MLRKHNTKGTIHNETVSGPLRKMLQSKTH